MKLKYTCTCNWCCWRQRSAIVSIGCTCICFTMGWYSSGYSIFGKEHRTDEMLFVQSYWRMHGVCLRRPGLGIWLRIQRKPCKCACFEVPQTPLSLPLPGGRRMLFRLNQTGGPEVGLRSPSKHVIWRHHMRRCHVWCRGGQGRLENGAECGLLGNAIRCFPMSKLRFGC